MFIYFSRDEKDNYLPKIIVVSFMLKGLRGHVWIWSNKMVWDDSVQFGYGFKIK